MKKLTAFLASMAGRITIVLVMSAVVSASLALGLSDLKRRGEMERLDQEHAADRLQAFVATLDAADRSARKQLEATGGVGVSIAPEALAPGEEDADFAALLADRLGKSAQVQAYRANCPAQDATPPARCWLVGLKLDDGSALKASVRAPSVIGLQRPSLSPFYVAALALALGGIALIAARILAERARRKPPPAAPEPEPTGPDHLDSRLLAAITQDLQTPLKRLGQRLEKVTDPALRARLVADLGAMQDLVREGLDLARSPETPEEVSKVDLDALLERLVAEAKNSGEAARLTSRAGVRVRGRPQGLRRCLSNVIDNALTYGGDVEISASVDRDVVTVRVRDHGPGVPEDALETVFEPFVRLQDASSPQSEGAGLGLTLARSLAERNGGTLNVRNHPDGGLEAVLTLRTV